jgi:hypothetical protein
VASAEKDTRSFRRNPFNMSPKVQNLLSLSSAPCWLTAYERCVSSE